MKKIILNSLVAASLLFAASCKPEIDTPAGTTAGNANFSKYIAVGNSLTAGFADGGLYLEGQKAAYPNLLAAKMASVGGGNFTSPFFTDAQSNGSGYLTLSALVNGTPTLTNVTDKLAYIDPTHLAKYSGEVQNLGIPGMRVDLAFAAPYSAANPYMERLLTGTQVGTTTYFQFIQGRSHTFFSIWLGNNDALGWATNGGVTSDATNVLTDKSTFALLYSNLLNALTANGQKGVVATIPDVTAIPYFNTVTVAALLNAAKAINPAATTIYIRTGAGTVRAATADDLIRLPFQSSGLFGVPNPALGGAPYGLHPANPIANNWVLDKDEIVKVKDYVNSYNSSIKSLANSKGLAVADTYSYLNLVKVGVAVQGVNVNSAFITGGAFSLDGVHLTPRGNAIIGNVFIDAINAKYGSTIPTIDITQYRGVKFPDDKK
ncbi:SGNH/GDSL hydrolase family protein [Pedobacter endophyticus]|uniref:G-D-S-L family lipolytic protein n=1 Tax=Pedobacter endophyticus TaxID=2789740 RepID=A0A7S9PYT3_9SPHI|nr:SGNH/GDSL hydrolase family protein [Pedobacter endophyticus]QPH39200.1 G-D-S-L family lipolytic protein [Pedobacter endophyticus]